MIPVALALNIKKNKKTSNTTHRQSKAMQTGRKADRIIIIQVNVYSAVIMTSHCESSLDSSDECGSAPDGRQPSDQASPPIYGCHSPHPPSPFIITQPQG